MPQEVTTGGAQPWVTAVVTTYKRPELAKRAIRSVLAQAYQPLEIILVEDGTDSGIRAWLSEQGLNQVRYLIHDQNKGLAAARNTGLRNARGKYVAYLDDDDEWLPDKLARQVDLAEREKGKGSVAVVYCGAQIVGSDGQLLREARPRLRGDIRKEIAKKGLYTIPSSCLFRRAALMQVDGFDENLVSHIDHDIWLQLAEQGYAAEYVDECIVQVHEHRGSRMTTDIQARLLATKAFFEKWQPEFERWFGKRKGQTFASHYLARIMAGLGLRSAQSGMRRQGAKCFLSAIRHHPTRPSYYADMVAVLLGVRAYHTLMRLVRYLREARNE